MGCAAAQARDQVRQQIRPDGVNHAQPQHAGQFILALAGELFNGGRFLQYPLRLFNDPPADRCRCNLTGCALEQGNAQFVFQFAHGDAQGRLADVTGIGGTTKMAFAGNSDDVAQFVESHGQGICKITVGIWVLRSAVMDRNRVYV